MKRLKDVIISSTAIFALVANGMYLRNYNLNTTTTILSIISILSCCIALFYLWGGQLCLKNISKDSDIKEDNIEKRASKRHVVDKRKDSKKKISA